MPVFDLIGFAPVDIYLSQVITGQIVESNRFRLSTIVMTIFILIADRFLPSEKKFKWLFQGALLSQLSPLLFYWFPVLAGRAGDLLLPFLILYLGFAVRLLPFYFKIILSVLIFLMLINYLYINPLFLRDGFVDLY